MSDVQFEEDPVFDSYLDKQRQIFYKPSSSPVVSALIDNHIFKTEKDAGVFLLVSTGVFVVIIGFLFNKFVLSTPTINTTTSYVPAITQ